MIIDNVVAMLVDNLGSKSIELKEILAVASILQSSFDISTLQGIYRQITSKRLSIDYFAEQLDIAVQDGLLENFLGSSTYSFPHDRIKEAAKELISKVGWDINNLTLKAALHLLDQYDETNSEEDLFLPVDLLNTVPLSFAMEKVGAQKMIQINCKAAEESCNISAFAAALIYTRRAVKILKTSSKKFRGFTFLELCARDENYDMCLKLYNAAIKVESCVGDFELAYEYSKEVLAFAKSFDDKLDAYQSISDALGQREKHSEALFIELKVYRGLGQSKLHYNPINLLLKVNTTKKSLTRMTDDEIYALPIVEDKKIIAIIETLSKMTIRAFYCGKLLLSVMCSLRQIKLTLKHGLCPCGAYAFAGYANLCVMVFGEDDLGRRMTNVAYQVAKITNAKAYEAKIFFTTTK